MKRGLYIVVSLLVVVLLMRPLDCFAGARVSREAMDCCLKGKCAPTAQSDECCRNSTPNGGQAVLSKAAAYSGPPVVLIATSAFVGIAEPSTHIAMASLNHPPPSTGLTARYLPLLI